jgi:hypothetical protein
MTAYGGLFYLLSTVLELGIGESLWKACLPEGPILAAAAAALLGPEALGDPAPALFGGVTGREVSETPSILPAQQTEVCGELLVGLVGALSQAGTSPPAIFLDLAESSSGRLLVGFTSGSYVLFASPAPDSTAVASGLTRFLNWWPRSAPPPEATNALVALDQTGRLKPADAPRPLPALHASSAPTPAAACLLAQICGTLAFWFGTRANSSTGETPCPAGAFVTRFLAVPALLQSEPDTLTVVLPMERIDLELRRAALDRDPGWIPWLKRTVRFEFESGTAKIL